MERLIPANDRHVPKRLQTLAGLNIRSAQHLTLDPSRPRANRHVRQQKHKPVLQQIRRDPAA